MAWLPDSIIHQVIRVKVWSNDDVRIRRALVWIYYSLFRSSWILTNWHIPSPSFLLLIIKICKCKYSKSSFPNLFACQCFFYWKIVLAAGDCDFSSAFKPCSITQIHNTECFCLSYFATVCSSAGEAIVCPETMMTPDIYYKEIHHLYDLPCWHTLTWIPSQAPLTAHIDHWAIRISLLV